MTVEKRMLFDMRPEDVPSSEDIAAMAWPGETSVNMAADIAHILRHAGVDEPSGTWTGGAGPRLGRPLGSGVDLTDLGEMHRQSGGLADLTWHPEPVASDVYLQLLREWGEDRDRQPRQHPSGWWAERVAAMWSYIWAANFRIVTEVIEGPARSRGGEGLLVASFEHNSSAHGLERPHVHNLMPTKRASGRRDSGVTVTMTEGYGPPAWPRR